MSQKRIYFTPERRYFLEERTETELTGFEDLLAQSITGVKFITAAATENTFLGYLNGYVVVVHLMPTLPVVCDWFVDNLPEGYETDSEKPVFMPHWTSVSENRPLQTDKMFEYLLPTPYQMAFIQSCSQRGEDMHYSFVALNMENGELRHPLIPNVYSNGNLCFGEVELPQFDLRKGFEARINEVLKIWVEGRWNADLSPLGIDTIEMRNWFAFAPDTGEPAGDHSLAVFHNLARRLPLERAHEREALRELVSLLGGTVSNG